MRKVGLGLALLLVTACGSGTELKTSSVATTTLPPSPATTTTAPPGTPDPSSVAETKPLTPPVITVVSPSAPVPVPPIVKPIPPAPTLPPPNEFTFDHTLPLGGWKLYSETAVNALKFKDEPNSGPLTGINKILDNELGKGLILAGRNAGRTSLSRAVIGVSRNRQLFSLRLGNRLVEVEFLDRKNLTVVERGPFASATWGQMTFRPPALANGLLPSAPASSCSARLASATVLGGSVFVYLHYGCRGVDNDIALLYRARPGEIKFVSVLPKLNETSWRATPPEQVFAYQGFLRALYRAPIWKSTLLESADGITWRSLGEVRLPPVRNVNKLHIAGEYRGTLFGQLFYEIKSGDWRNYLMTLSSDDGGVSWAHLPGPWDVIEGKYRPLDGIGYSLSFDCFREVGAVSTDGNRFFVDERGIWANYCFSYRAAKNGPSELRSLIWSSR